MLAVSRHCLWLSLRAGCILSVLNVTVVLPYKRRMKITISNQQTTVQLRRPAQVPTCTGRLFSNFHQAPVPYHRRRPGSRRARDLTGRIN